MPDDASVFDEPLEVYVAELQAISPLSRAEEIDCIEHVNAGDLLAELASKRLVEANLMLVVTIAKRYVDNRSNVLDLIQRGNEGLLEAVRSLSTSSPHSFLDRAAEYIERAISDAISGSTVD